MSRIRNTTSDRSLRSIVCSKSNHCANHTQYRSNQIPFGSSVNHPLLLIHTDIKKQWRQSAAKIHNNIAILLKDLLIGVLSVELCIVPHLNPIVKCPLYRQIIER